MRSFLVQGREALVGLVGGCLLLCVSPALADNTFDPVKNDEVGRLVDELAGQGIDSDWLVSTMRAAEFRQSVLDAMSGAAERHLRWDEYRDIFIQPERIKAGVEFIEAHREAFERAQSRYGVAPEIIAAIIGVETFYGRHTGRHRVLDSLSTLAFHHPGRGDFFRGELAAFLSITHEAGVDPEGLQGSYAGAMGYPQFIPTSYQAYAVDFDDDGIRDLWGNPVDAIGSVGHYFQRHGWTPGGAIVSDAQGPATRPEGIEFNRTRKPYAPVSELARVGIEPLEGSELSDAYAVIPLALDYAEDEQRIDYKLGHENFYVITRYNHSHLYAMAVTTLAERIGNAVEEQS